jgi:hypothetical protein
VAASGETSEPSTSSRVSGRQLARAFCQLRHELVGDFLVDYDAFGRHADLPHVRKRSEDCAVDCSIDIGVLQHDHRCLATELQQRWLQMTTAELPDDATNPGRASEIDATDLRCGDQCFDDRCGVLWSIGDDVNDTIRQAASTSARPMSRWSPGQASDALGITVLPQANAIAMARVPRMTGAFHGAMPRHTPAA